jgi:hypothetical protein
VFICTYPLKLWLTRGLLPASKPAGCPRKWNALAHPTPSVPSSTTISSAFSITEPTMTLCRHCFLGMLWLCFLGPVPSGVRASPYEPLDCSKTLTTAGKTICKNYTLGQDEARQATLFAALSSLVAMGQRADDRVAKTLDRDPRSMRTRRQMPLYRLQNAYRRLIEDARCVGAERTVLRCRSKGLANAPAALLRMEKTGRAPLDKTGSSSLPRSTAVVCRIRPFHPQSRKYWGARRIP